MTRGATTRGRPVARALACALVATQLACYAWVPAAAGESAGAAAGALAPGARVALEVNDPGRVALASTLAPSITRVEGTLVDARGEELVLALAGYTQIRGGYTQLTGDTVRVRREHVAAVRQRRLSRRRTLFAIGTGVAVVVAFLAARGIGGRGVPGEGDDGGGPDQ
jgi:hypothetical protein